MLQDICISIPMQMADAEEAGFDGIELAWCCMGDVDPSRDSTVPGF